MNWKRDYFTEAHWLVADAILVRELKAATDGRDFGHLNEILGHYDNMDSQAGPYGGEWPSINAEVEDLCIEVKRLSSGLSQENGEGEKGNVWDKIGAALNQYETGKAGRDLAWHDWLMIDVEKAEAKENALRTELLEAARESNSSRLASCIELYHNSNDGFLSPTVADIISDHNQIMTIREDGYRWNAPPEYTDEQSAEMENLYGEIAAKIERVDTQDFRFTLPAGQVIKHHERKTMEKSFAESLKQAGQERGQAFGFGQYRGHDLKVDIPPNTRNCFNVSLNKDGVETRPDRLQGRTFVFSKFNMGDLINDIDQSVKRANTQEINMEQSTHSDEGPSGDHKVKPFLGHKCRNLFS